MRVSPVSSGGRTPGKSTLTNAIIGQKIAITSNKPQTTRHVIRGILHRANAQLVLVDTPGLHRPRTLLGERLNDLVRETWSEVDVIGVCFPADEPVGRGDRFISRGDGRAQGDRHRGGDQGRPGGSGDGWRSSCWRSASCYDFAEIVPVSAVSGHQVDTLVDVMIKHLPESPQLYPDDVLTDEPEQVLIAELIREAALEGVRDELPHSIAVLVEEMMVEGNITKIYADLYVERDSQKSIVIGTTGARLKEVGTRARAEIEELLGAQGLPGPARPGRQGVAARSEAAPQARLLTSTLYGIIHDMVCSWLARLCSVTTRAMRNRYLDLLRAVATVRVVVYHSTGWAALTVVFPAMSVMFALAGSMMAASLDRPGRWAVERRLRRLLPSLWVLVAIAVPAMLLDGLGLGLEGAALGASRCRTRRPTAGGSMASAAIWYLRDFLWFVLLSPLVLPVFRRFPLPTILMPYVALAVAHPRRRHRRRRSCATWPSTAAPGCSASPTTTACCAAWPAAAARRRHGARGRRRGLDRSPIPGRAATTSTTSRSATRCGRRPSSWSLLGFVAGRYRAGRGC